MSNILLGEHMKLKNKKLVYGVGVNDADYAVQKFEPIGYVGGKQKYKLVWICPYYRVWKHMLERGYSEKFQEKHPTYKGCSVSEEWLTFSNFKAWMKTQHWEGLQLDKDLLIEGNKVYSADTCVFVTPMVNSFVNDQGVKRGEWLIGVNWHKKWVNFKPVVVTHLPKNEITSDTSLANKGLTRLGANAS